MAKRGAYKLNPDVVNRICEAVRKGASQSIAADYGGISRGTLRNWLEAGQAGESLKMAGFFKTYREAEAQAAMRHIERIDQAADKDWTASKWWLERRYRDDFGPHSRHEISGPNGGTIDISTLPDPGEELLAFLREE